MITRNHLFRTEGSSLPSGRTDSTVAPVQEKVLVVAGDFDIAAVAFAERSTKFHQTRDEESPHPASASAHRAAVAHT